MTFLRFKLILNDITLIELLGLKGSCEILPIEVGKGAGRESKASIFAGFVFLYIVGALGLEPRT